MIIFFDILYAFILAICFSILAYPISGVPFIDHHSTFFSIIAFLFFYYAFQGSNDNYFLFIPLLLKADMPKGFFYIDRYIPQIVIDLKYFTNFNFIGSKINGYKKNKCIITKDAANALKHVQKDLQHFGYGLKVFDDINYI